jgi:hypothetical protein
LEKPVFAFDVDGTLTAKGQGDVSLLEMKPNRKILDLALYYQDLERGVVVITTARDESIRKETEKWLKAQGLRPKHVLMRGKGDPRPDPEVKVEQVNILRKNFGNGITMYDDKPENCKAVREQTGIKCVLVRG